MRPAHNRSKTSIGGMWPVQTDMPAMHHQQYSTSSTPMSMQQYRFNSPPTAVTPYGTPFQVPYMTPVTPYTPSEWSASGGMDTKQMQGLGMDFADANFTMAGSDAPEDIIHLGNAEAWPMSGSDSPDRRSSTSDSEVTELTENTTAHSRQSSAAFDAGADRDMRRSRSLHRHSRSLSRTPASRAASKRAHRRQLSCQAVPHARNPSACGFMPPLPQTPALPDGQTDHLVMDFAQASFMNTGMTDHDMQMDSDFQNNFDAFVDLPMAISQSSSSHATRMMTPPSEGIFWENTLDSEVFAMPMQQQQQQLSEHQHQHNNSCCSVEDPEKPDLFESLREEASNPPEEDMHPEDPDMVPQEQEPRFEGDLYTPRWVRGQGNKREGYCGLCKPGRWLVLKNSAYWYDKSFTHGISAATGQPFEGPRETRRMAGNPDVWEGLCGGCDDWIALISSKKKGTTWFRHAYKVSSCIHTLEQRDSMLTLLSVTERTKTVPTRKPDRRRHRFSKPCRTQT